MLCHHQQRIGPPGFKGKRMQQSESAMQKKRQKKTSNTNLEAKFGSIDQNIITTKLLMD
jgi:hypothetical protein